MSNILEQLQNELNFIKNYTNSSLMISTTSKHALKFRVLPRRVISNTALSCLMINDIEALRETIFYFDGKVDSIYVDVEQKQDINLFGIARKMIRHSNLVAVKPNDTTLESCDLLIRYQFNDDLYDKKVIVVGTGNLASKIAVRLAERQAKVFIKGRTLEKEKSLVNGLNLFLPKNTPHINSLKEKSLSMKADVIISFISGQLSDETTLYPYINDKTLIIDGGINNFSNRFIEQLLSANISIIRLDTRIALAYQMLNKDDYTQMFFNEIFGQTEINNVKVVAGGFIGVEGTVIVDNIRNPRHLLGIADGKGGVKKYEQITESERSKMRKIKQDVPTLD